MREWTPEEIEAARANLTPADRAELDRHLLESLSEAPEALMEFIPWVSPSYTSPYHLKPLVDALERARHTPLRLLVSVSPRHAKTETLLHWIAQTLKSNPAKQCAYITHTDRLARKKSAKCKLITEAAGVSISDESSSKSDWRTGMAGGGLWATSRDGALTGEGFDILLIDDIVKDRASAESAVQRDADYEWFVGTAFNRLEPGGSCVVNATRWHPDDLIGRLSKDPTWEVINLPAINEDGTPLWPERWSLDALAEIRAKSEYDWASLYMGQPRTREGKLFGAIPPTYTQRPPNLRIAIGVDCAYSAKTSADWSVAVVLGEHHGDYYVLDVVRKQCLLEEFASDLVALQQRYPSAPMRWDASTTEAGTAGLLRRLGATRLYTVLAKGDAFTRGQAAAVLWNKCKIHFPPSAPWLEGFTSTLSAFTGVGDRHDDDIAALASAVELLPASPVTLATPPENTPEWYVTEEKRMMDARMRVQQTRRSPWDTRK